MAALIALVTLVPITIAVIASVWSDFQSVQDTIENRKLDANNFGMPSRFDALRDQIQG
jgi:uncharacterized protein (DUF2141 family)